MYVRKMFKVENICLRGTHQHTPMFIKVGAAKEYSSDQSNFIIHVDKKLRTAPSAPSFCADCKKTPHKLQMFL